MVRIQDQEITPTRHQRQYRHGSWTYRKLINGVSDLRPTSLGDIASKDANLSQAVSAFMVADKPNASFMAELFQAYEEERSVESFWNRMAILAIIGVGVLTAGYLLA